MININIDEGKCSITLKLEDLNKLVSEVLIGLEAIGKVVYNNQGEEDARVYCESISYEMGEHMLYHIMKDKNSSVKEMEISEEDKEENKTKWDA